ncbi:Gfo/Idh/MocA family oxidoreductase [Rhizobium sp. RCAM05350]|nr:Gfo/Idh/MocA family oxidoreductase [Rhizobium sp. RCAM05350]
MAADPLIDAVYLATPNTAHFDQALILLNAGKPVLIEKPLVTTAAQAQALARTGCREADLYYGRSLDRLPSSNRPHTPTSGR